VRNDIAPALPAEERAFGTRAPPHAAPGVAAGPTSSSSACHSGGETSTASLYYDASRLLRHEACWSYHGRTGDGPATADMGMGQQ
jgi:hypothetical protein